MVLQADLCVQLSLRVFYHELFDVFVGERHLELMKHLSKKLFD